MYCIIGSLRLSVVDLRFDVTASQRQLGSAVIGPLSHVLDTAGSGRGRILQASRSVKMIKRSGQACNVAMR